MSSIIINGSPKDFFASPKGFRQEDSLSPFLFILDMLCLRRMLSTAKLHDKIKGFNPSLRNQGKLHLTCLFYADDSLYFFILFFLQN